MVGSDNETALKRRNELAQIAEKTEVVQRDIEGLARRDLLKKSIVAGILVATGGTAMTGTAAALPQIPVQE